MLTILYTLLRFIKSLPHKALCENDLFFRSISRFVVNISKVAISVFIPIITEEKVKMYFSSDFSD